MGLVSVLVYLFDEPVQRGFFCGDESIRYPVPESQTVGDLTVALVAVGVPIFVVREETTGISLLSLSISQYIVARTVKNEGV